MTGWAAEKRAWNWVPSGEGLAEWVVLGPQEWGEGQSVQSSWSPWQSVGDMVQPCVLCWETTGHWGCWSCSRRCLLGKHC